jgi:hypothetical protein
MPAFNSPNDNHFILLGVTRFSKKKEIKKAYHVQIKKWHPDKFENLPEKYQEALEMTKRIIEAFELLENYIPPSADNNTHKFSYQARADTSHSAKSSRLDIPRVRVKSSNLYAVGYDKDRKVLQIEFRSGSVYQYYDVPESIFTGLLNAGSKGRYFNSKIGGYRYESV